MQSLAVINSVPPASTYVQWRNEELSGVALNGPEDDADGDGIKNGLEFVFRHAPESRRLAAAGWCCGATVP
jgi:hypothetical protein